MWRKFGLVSRSQKGFTLIELIVAIAISSAIGGVIVSSIYQVNSDQATDRARMTCVKEVENAVHYIVRDVQMAQMIQPAADPSGFPLTLIWYEWDKTDWENDISHQVIYSIVGDELERDYSVAGGESEETIVARYISAESANTKCWYNGSVLNLKITATISGFPKEVSETREIEITPRVDW